ncbi:LysR family transcriptional regulator [Bradyrhizobium sp. ORS 86]|uniref:LysR family transcriptional regulator n=1 Tax=Bradyrhizobium sp. ORS 86 TaxID=1685970 RepID=UPI00388FCA4F
MDLKHLRTFATVAELGTISKAAQHLRVAQPALSRQISALEEELGLTLFDRVGRRLFLNGAGEQLLGSCRALLGSASALREQAQLLRHGDAGILRVAASPVQIETVFSTFLHVYARHYPKVEVKLIEAIGPKTLSLLERGEIHLGVSLLQSIQADDRSIGIYPVPSVTLLAAYDPCSFKFDGTIDLRRVALHPLLLLDPGFVVRRTFDRASRLARLKPSVFFESSVPHNLLAFAEAGLGVAIIPSVVQTHRYGLRVARITDEGKPLSEPLAVVWDKRREHPQYVLDFREALAAHMRELSRVTRRPASASGNHSKRRDPAKSRGR